MRSDLSFYTQTHCTRSLRKGLRLPVSPIVIYVTLHKMPIDNPSTLVEECVDRADFVSKDLNFLPQIQKNR